MNLFPKSLDSEKTDTIGGVYMLGVTSEIDDYFPLYPKDFKKTAILKTEHIKTHTKKTLYDEYVPIIVHMSFLLKI